MALTVSPGLTIGLTPASDSGINRQDGITNVIRPVFTGRADVGAKVKVVAGTVSLGTATANNLGLWALLTPQWAASTFRRDGVYTVTATATNRQRSISQPANLTLTIDRSPPRAQSIVYDQSTGSLTVGFSEAVAGVQLSNVRLGIPRVGSFPLSQWSDLGINISPAGSGGKSYTFTPSTKIVAPGTYTASIAAAPAASITDISGNRLVGISRPFRVS